jgi:hypothetical protein
MPYKDRNQQLAYFRQKNKEPARRNDQLKRTKQASRFKKDLLSVFPCVCCNETDADLIDWHHVDPSSKLNNVTRFNLNHEDWWTEVLKCVPLCVLCHRKIHTDKLCLLPIHL